jgi:hypothetical protein
MTTRSRITSGGLAVLFAATVLAACGGDGGTEKAPRIPAAVAERLAGLSDEAAAALEAGDECAAQEAADELEREALKAQGQIPANLLPEVQDGVQQLAAGISCEPEPIVIETVPEETTTEEKKPPEEDPACPPGLEKKEDGHDKKDEGGCGGPSGGEDEHGKEEEQD